jgi:hypothetical protein
MNDEFFVGHSALNIPSRLPLLHGDAQSSRVLSSQPGPTTNPGNAQRVPGFAGAMSFRKVNMLNVRTLFALALILPLLGMTPPAQAAKTDARAARAECFRQAQAAVNTIGFRTTTADKNGRNGCLSPVLLQNWHTPVTTPSTLEGPPSGGLFVERCIWSSGDLCRSVPHHL